jgi:hypothetical protein
MAIAFDVGQAMIHSRPKLWVIETCSIFPTVARTVFELTGSSEESLVANTVSGLSFGCPLTDTFVIADSPTFLWAVMDVFGEVVADDIALCVARMSLGNLAVVVIKLRFLRCPPVSIT